MTSYCQRKRNARRLKTEALSYVGMKSKLDSEQCQNWATKRNLNNELSWLKTMTSILTLILARILQYDIKNNMKMREPSSANSWEIWNLISFLCACMGGCRYSKQMIKRVFCDLSCLQKANNLKWLLKSNLEMFNENKRYL